MGDVRQALGVKGDQVRDPRLESGGIHQEVIGAACFGGAGSRIGTEDGLRFGFYLGEGRGSENGCGASMEVPPGVPSPFTLRRIHRKATARPPQGHRIHLGSFDDDSLVLLALITQGNCKSSSWPAGWQHCF